MDRTEKPQLFHGSAQRIDGDWIEPRHNKTSAWSQYKDDPQQQKKHIGNFIFGGANFAAALTYACKLNSTTRTENGKPYGYMANVGATPLPNGIVTHSTIAHKDEFLAQLAQATPTIYDIPKNNTFEAVYDRHGSPTGEYISCAPVAVEECKIIPVEGIEACMRAGSQIFFLKDGMEKEAWYDITHTFHNQHREALEAGGDEAGQLWLKFMREQVAQGTVEHYNATLDICPLDLETGKFPPGEKSAGFAGNTSVRKITPRSK